VLCAPPSLRFSEQNLLYQNCIFDLVFSAGRWIHFLHLSVHLQPSFLLFSSGCCHCTLRVRTCSSPIQDARGFDPPGTTLLVLFCDTQARHSKEKNLIGKAAVWLIVLLFRSHPRWGGREKTLSTNATLPLYPPAHSVDREPVSCSCSCLPSFLDLNVLTCRVHLHPGRVLARGLSAFIFPAPPPGRDLDSKTSNHTAALPAVYRHRSSLVGLKGHSQELGYAGLNTPTLSKTPR
jgi:hypothetical protein